MVYANLGDQKVDRWRQKSRFDTLLTETAGILPQGIRRFQAANGSKKLFDLPPFLLWNGTEQLKEDWCARRDICFTNDRIDQCFDCSRRSLSEVIDPQ